MFGSSIRTASDRLPFDHWPLALRTATVLAFALLSTSVSHVSLAAPMVREPSREALSLAPAHQGDSAELRQITEMLNRGEDKAAKTQLAEFLRRYPDDTRAIELAGTLFLQERNYSLARISFNRVLASNPANYRVLSKLGIVLLQQGEKTQAEAAWKKVISLHPGEPLARRYLGWIEESRGNLDGAVSHYRAAIAGGDLPADVLTDVHLALGRIYNVSGRYTDTVGLLAPHAAKAERSPTADAVRFQLAYAYVDLQRVSEAEATIRKLEATIKPGDVDLLFLKAYLQTRTNPAEGRKRLRALIRAHPAYARRARMWVARSFAREGNSTAAAKSLEELAAQAEPADLPEILMAFAAVQVSAGKPHEAARVLDVYLRKYPDSSAIRYMLAELRFQAGDTVEARALLKKVLAQNPEYAQGYALSGQLARARGDWAAAEADLQTALSLDASLVNAWVNLAGVRVSLKDLPGAEFALRDGLNRNRGDPTLQYELAGVQDEMGKWREANAGYRTVLAAYPSHVPALNNLALNLAEHENDLSEARRLAEKAYSIGKRSPRIQDTYGWILVLDNDAERGLPLLEQAARGSPGDAAVSYHLGVAMIKTGKTAEGKRLLQGALASGLPQDLRAKAQALVN